MAIRNENRRGYGNDALMEITKRFPQALGNLAEEREIPTFPQPIIVVLDKKKKEHVNHASHTKTLTLPNSFKESSPLLRCSVPPF
jgi:hypothetical protein